VAAERTSTDGVATLLSVGEAEEAEGRRRCDRFLVGHGRRSAADLLAEIDPGTEMDRYGTGGVVAELEDRIAALFGKQSAVFLPSGTMAQQIVLRVHADRRQRRTFVAHPACHLDWRELRGYQRLHGLAMRQAGDVRRPLTLDDLRSVAEPPAALLVELPQRDLGGILPTWAELHAQLDWAHARGAATHLDGARVWESAPFYERSLAELVAGFDTVYASFYKLLGAIAGCCVAGEADVVAEVREWRTRHGGTLFGLWPYAASASAALDCRLPLMADYRDHAVAIAAALRELPDVEVVPDPPQTPMMHLLLRRDAAALRRGVLTVARDHGVWTFPRWFSGDTPTVQRVELVVGDATMRFTPGEVAEILGAVLAAG
jgi:threonine aldolase